MASCLSLKWHNTVDQHNPGHHMHNMQSKGTKLLKGITELPLEGVLFDCLLDFCLSIQSTINTKAYNYSC